MVVGGIAHRFFSMKLDQNLLRPVLNLSAILVALGVNIWANVAPINGLNIGEISNTIFREVVITPANYAFAIWGLIYLGLIAFGIYQILPAQRQNPQLRRMGYLLVLACLAQSVWVIFFLSRLFTLSLVAMLGILLALIGAYLRLGIGAERTSRAQKWFIHIPISIYLAWISVATIVNVATTLYNLGWDGWGVSSSWWTVIALIVGAAIAATVSLQHADIAFSLVIVWAYVAIAVRHANQLLIAATAAGLAIALVVFLLLDRVRRQSRQYD